ncbi:MAG TPA: hypothetical protein VGN55_16495 [Xanthobacteraceae bacterium]
MLLSLSVSAGAQDAKKYSAWEGMWGRGSPPGSWDPTKPPGPGQQAPLTSEYQAVYEANQVKAKTGVAFDPKYTCGPVGMPRVMALGTMEFIVKPTVVYMLLESTSPLRRIYTDGRAWPKDIDPSYVGYSIGKWLDTDDANGALEIETRAMRGLRLMDNSGIPLAADGETVVKERLSIDKADPDIMHTEITTIDHAFTHPWTVSRFYKRVRNGRPQEDNCAEENRMIAIGGRMYLTDSEGYLMPLQKDEPPPDPKLFQKYFGPKK